jgi:hypothetical protein
MFGYDEMPLLYTLTAVPTVLDCPWHYFARTLCCRSHTAQSDQWIIKAMEQEAFELCVAYRHIRGRLCPGMGVTCFEQPHRWCEALKPSPPASIEFPYHTDK